MIDALPPWLRTLVLVGIAGGLAWLWILNLRGLWNREQQRTVAATPAPADVPGTGRASRGLDVVLLIGAAVAIRRPRLG